MESAAVRRALFSSNNCANSRLEGSLEEQRSDTELNYKEAETSSAKKGRENSEDSDTVEEVISSSTATESPKDLCQRILIVGLEMAKQLDSRLSEACSVFDIGVRICSPSEVLLFCSRERFVLIFIDTRTSEEASVPKICSTIRYNSSSINRSTSIIGIASSNVRGQDLSSQGLNDVITLPLKEESLNQLLLKWAGQTSCKGMPLTPESPEDDIITARKAAEIIKETEEQSMLVAAHIENCEQTKRDQDQSSRINEPNINSSHLPRSSQIIYPEQSNPPGLLTTITNTNTRDNPVITVLPDLCKLTSNTRAPVSGPFHQRLGEPLMNHPPQGHYPGYQVQNNRSFPAHSPPAPMDQYPPGHHMDHSRQFHMSSPLYQYSHPAAVLPCRPVLHHPLPSNYGTLPVNPQERRVIKGANTMASTASTSSFQTPLSRVPPNIGGSPAYIVSGTPGSKDMKITLVEDDLSKHSSKERIRRERIKESCDQLRFLLPNITGKKTDMASILEMTVKFVRLVNERIPPQVMQEIADKLAASTLTTQGRKRAQKDATSTKQARPRTSSPIFDGMQRSLPVASPLITEGAYHMRNPAMISSPGPVYLPHMHMVPGQHSVPHQAGYGYPIQTTVVSHGMPCTTTTPKDVSYLPQNLPQTSVLNYGASGGTPKDVPAHMRAQSEGPAQVGGCPYRTLICGTPLSVSTSASNDMPQQWNFLKLPPINAISPSNSSLDLSSSASSTSLDQESIESDRLSSMEASPMWEEQT